MAVSGWGGTTAWINEGLRRAEEERKRKEEEERRRLEEERRRRASLIPFSISDRTRGNATRTPPTQTPSAQPSVGLSNPYQVDTSTPEVGYTPPASSVSQTAPSTITPMAVAPQQPISEPPEEETPTPVRRNERPATGIVNPNLGLAQPDLPGALPQLAQTLGPLVQQGWERFVQNPLQSLADIHAGASEAALQLPVVGLPAAKSADAVGDVLSVLSSGKVEMPEYLQQVIDQRVRQEELDNAPQDEEALTDWQDITTPGQAVTDRYKYNLTEAPDDPATEVLRTFAPAVNVLLNAAEAIGWTDEAGLAGINLPGTDMTLGEAFTIGSTAAVLYNEQRREQLIRDGWTVQGNIWTPPQPGQEIGKEEGDKRVAEDQAYTNWLLPDLNVPFGTTTAGFEQPESIPDLWAALQLAQDDYLAAVQPTAEQKETASPSYLVAVESYARSMAHHGAAAVEQMFDDLADIPGRITQLTTQIQGLQGQMASMPPGPEREAMAWQAAALGAEVKRLNETHPLEYYEKNANWWMAIPAETILSLSGLLDIGLGVARLTPKSRRIIQGERVMGITAEQASEALQAGRGLVATGEQQYLDAINSIFGNLAQINSSQAMVDARNNWRALTSLWQGFTEKADIRTIWKAYATDPQNLLQNGIPVDQLVDPSIRTGMLSQNVMPAGATVDMPNYMFGPAAIGEYNSIKSFPSLSHVVEFIDALPSLQGSGPVNWGDVAADIHQLLVRGGATTHGVSTLPGVPEGAIRATTKLTGNGTATVQYYGAGKDPLLETAPMGLIQANQAVADFKTWSKGNNVAQNPLEVFSGLERSMIGASQLYSDPSNLINNIISNRAIIAADGVWSWKGPQQILSYLQGVTGGMVQFDEIARRFAPGMDTSGGIASQFRFGENIPILGKIGKVFKKATQWDDANLRLMSYGRTHEDFMSRPGWNNFQKAATEYFTGEGWTDKEVIANAVSTIYDAGLSGGKRAMLESFYNIANGTMPTSLSGLIPNYRDVWSDLAPVLDGIVKEVRPETVDDFAQTIVELTNHALTELAAVAPDYLETVRLDRHTILENQEEIARLLNEAEVFGINPEEYLNETVGTVRDIQEDIIQMMQMAPGHQIGVHAQELWHAINYLRDTVRSQLQTIGDALLPNTSGAERRAAFEQYREIQRGMYGEMAAEVQGLIEATRRAIVEGVAPPGGMYDPMGILRNMGLDPNEVFRVNEAASPRVFKRDPMAEVASEEGDRGIQFFMAQMVALIQRFPSAKGFEHWVKAMDDVTQAGADIFGPMRGKVATILKQIDELTPLTENDKRVFGQINKLWGQYADLRNSSMVEYYEYAYTRYQAASVAIVQAANGIGNLPTFKPLDGWGLPHWGNSPQVTMLGINFRDPQQFLIRTPDGKTMAIPRRFVPMETIQQWNKSADLAYEQLAEQVNGLAEHLFVNGTESQVINDLIANIRSASKNPYYEDVQKGLADMMGNPNGEAELGSDLYRWLRGQIMDGANLLLRKLPEIAQANTSPSPHIDLQGVRKFVNTIGPTWDNTLAGANRAAEQMASFSMVDFINRYGADLVASLFVPFSYWVSRQGKNMVERMLFKPAVFGHVSRAQKVIESEAGRNDYPSRYRTAINTDIGVDYANLPIVGQFFEGANEEDLMMRSPIPRWAPFGLNYILQGWSDLDRANRAAEMLLGKMEASGFPGWDGLANMALLATELGSAIGLSPYQHWRDLAGMATGRAEEISLANYGFWNNILAQGYTAVTGETIPYVNRFYDPYLTARDVTNQRFGVDDSAKPILAAGQAAYEGRELAPEFVRDYPNAPQQWNGAARMEALENIIWGIVGSFMGTSLSTMDPNEIERLEAQERYTDMGYGPENTAGSRERTQALDPSSPNYVPGLSAGQSAYQVIGEGLNRESITPSPGAFPYLPTYETRRIDEGVLLGDYLDKRDAIYTKYSAEESEMLSSHPEWTGTLVDDPAYNTWADDNDAGTGFYQRRQAELDALDAEYPSVAQQYKEPTAASLRGASPQETTEAAVQRLIIQAREENEHLKPGDYPADGSRSDKDAYRKQQDAYEAAVLARLQELLADPAALSASVFERPLDATGPYSEQPSPRVGPEDRSYLATGPTRETETTGEIGTTGQPQSATTTRPGVATDAAAGQAGVGQQPAQQAATSSVAPNMGSVDPNNQWAEEMADAEQQHGLPPGLLQEVARNESSFDPNAVSGAGAQGLLQIMPATWAEWAPEVGVKDVFDPASNIAVAAAYLGWLWNALPADQRDIETVMTAYNWGIGNVLEKGAGAAPPETKAYSSTIASAVSGADMTTPDTQTQQMFIRPVDTGPGSVSQGYGANVESYREWNDEHGHEGIDYGVEVGTPVKASAGGTVVFAGTGNGFENYGNYIVISHGDGYQTYYAHLDSFDVEVGDTVEQGDYIAKSGNTGRSTGPHLHFGIRQEGSDSGPYGMIDPTDFILGRDGVTQMAAAPAASVPPTAPTETQVASVSPAVSKPTGSARPPEATAGTRPTAPATTGTINVGVTAEQALQQAEDKYKTPERLAFDEARAGAWEKAYGRIQSTYPEHADLFDVYRAVNDEDREAWRNENPMIRALNLLVYNEKEHAQVEELFGEGSVAVWAAIPRGPNIGEAAGDYYRQHPDSFLTKAWIQGRPRPFDEDAEFNPEAQVARDFGTDYATAKEMFGDNIWDIVRQYYASVPRYVEGGDNSAWIAFKEQYPQFDTWRRWWYALMDSQQGATSGQRGWYSGSFGFGSDFERPDKPAYIKAVEAQRMQPPAYERGAGSGAGDWRRYLELARLGIRNPRR